MPWRYGPAHGKPYECFRECQLEEDISLLCYGVRFLNATV